MERVYELDVYKLAEVLSDMVWHDTVQKHEGQISIFYFQRSVNAYVFSFDVGITCPPLPCTCPPLPKNKVHATHELPGEWQAGADIQAVYCDRRWQAGLRSGATSLFDVRRFTPWRDWTFIF